MKNQIRNCTDCQARFADLLLDSTSLPAPVQDSLRAHMSTCTACDSTIKDLQATFAAMDDWTVPEPSPFFDTRLHARLREEQARQPEGFLERVRSFLLFSTGRQLRPAVAGALALVLVASGGSFVGIHGLYPEAAPTHTSATFEDLRVLDNNAQALQQMDQLLDDSGDDGDATPTT